MLNSDYMKSVRRSRQHQKRMKAIFARRHDICHNCAFFKDGRFCVNPKNAKGNAWADQTPVVDAIMVTATQGCELFDAWKEITIREPDPDALAESDAYYRNTVLKRP
jgi:hypothetical protein